MFSPYAEPDCCTASQRRPAYWDSRRLSVEPVPRWYVWRIAFKTAEQIGQRLRSALLRQALPFLGGDPRDQAGAARVAGAEDRGLALPD